MSRDIKKRVEIAIHELHVVLEGLERIFQELNRCRNDIKVAVNAHKTDFYRCTCNWLREKEEPCQNPECSESKR